MKKVASEDKLFIVLVSVGVAAWAISASAAPNVDLWPLATKEGRNHRFSTLFTAHDVRQELSAQSGLDHAVDWCKRTGVTKVYVEVFRDGYQADSETIKNASQRLTAAGLIVSGCVTTTRVGKASTGWKDVACCYTDKTTQEKLQAIFEYAAGFFDEIMIDDFWFTDCTCPDCDAARRARMVTIGDRTFPVNGDSWEDYRCELMVRLSQARILAPARRVNPKARLIIKYPQWYDNFHLRGYDVLRETADFDRIWVGTETRDYTDRHWGGTPQYNVPELLEVANQVRRREIVELPPTNRLIAIRRRNRECLILSGCLDCPSFPAMSSPQTAPQAFSRFTPSKIRT